MGVQQFAHDPRHQRSTRRPTQADSAADQHRALAGLPELPHGSMSRCGYARGVSATEGRMLPEVDAQSSGGTFSCARRVCQALRPGRPRQPHVPHRTSRGAQQAEPGDGADDPSPPIVERFPGPQAGRAGPRPSTRGARRQLGQRGGGPLGPSWPARRPRGGMRGLLMDRTSVRSRPPGRWAAPARGSPWSEGAGRSVHRGRCSRFEGWRAAGRAAVSTRKSTRDGQGSPLVRI